MAITSTLRKGSYNWVLRLVDASSSDRVDFPLLENYAPASLDLAAEAPSLYLFSLPKQSKAPSLVSKTTFVGSAAWRYAMV